MAYTSNALVLLLRNNIAGAFNTAESFVYFSINEIQENRAENECSRGENAEMDVWSDKRI